MAKRNKKGMTDTDFNALVDDGFKPKRQQHSGGNRTGVWVPPPQLRRDLAREGQQEGLTTTAARFNGAMSRIFGTRGTLSPESVKFLNEFDAHARAIAKAHGIELAEDDE